MVECIVEPSRAMVVCSRGKESQVESKQSVVD